MVYHGRSDATLALAHHVRIEVDGFFVSLSTHNKQGISLSRATKLASEVLEILSCVLFTIRVATSLIVHKGTGLRPQPDSSFEEHFKNCF